MLIDRDLTSKAIAEYGIITQQNKCIEELNECAVEVAHMRDHRGNVQDLISEIADVMIMLSQICDIYQITDKDIQGEIDYKEERLKNRLNAK